MADSARRYSEHGFRAWQLKLGDDPLMDARRTHAVAEALPSDTCFLTSDANAGWTSAQALRYLAAIEGIDAFLEQPCRTVPELSRVRSHTDRPLLVDESVKDTADLLSVIGLGLGDALNITPTRVGGLTKAAKLRDICVAAGLMILVDEPMGADLATGATSQLAASVPSANLIAASFFSHETMPLLYRPKGRAAVSPTFDAGTFRWNEAPGLGVEIDESTFGDPIAVYRLEDFAQ
jgi:L-alanine-DL-glutamate epimerase-like enolase superfamily enzyme